MHSLESFCKETWGTSYSKVQSQINKSDYSTFTLPKRGGVRTVYGLSHSSSLFTLQKKLLPLFESYPLPICVKGFKKGENYIKYLDPHIGSRFFLRLDIKDFFPSITTTHILTALKSNPIDILDEDKEKLLNLICDIVTLDGFLPQGACTSPIVSNIVMTRADQRILKYCQTLNICYSRYADDMLFSSSSFNFSEKNWFRKKISYILRFFDLHVNLSKTKIAENQLVLNGYVISNEGIHLSRNRLSDIRHLCSFVENTSALKKLNPDSFLAKVNELPLKHRNLSIYPFSTVFQVSQFLCGYRAHLISFIESTSTNPSFQKTALKLVHRLEHAINLIS